MRNSGSPHFDRPPWPKCPGPEAIRSTFDELEVIGTTGGAYDLKLVVTAPIASERPPSADELRAESEQAQIYWFQAAQAQTREAVIEAGAGGRRA